MTIASTVSAETMLGNGSTRSFPFTFRVWPGEVQVVITDPTAKATDVTPLAHIALNSAQGSSPGGQVTYPAAETSPPLPAGWSLTVLRDMDFLQNVRLVNAARFDPVVMEQALDRLTATDQQLHEENARAVKVVVGSAQAAADLLDEVLDAAKTAKASEGNAAGSAAAAAQSEAGAAISAAQAKADADRATALVDPAVLASSVYNIRKALVAAQAVPSGSVVTLPGFYYPTRDVLYLTYQGVTCTPRLSGVEASGQYQYEEVGTDPDVPSNQIKVCFDVAAGDVLDMWVVASAAGRNIEAIEALLAETQAAAAQAKTAEDGAEAEADRAEMEADRAEDAARSVPDVNTALDGQVAVARNVGGTMVAEYENPPSPTVAEQRAVLAGDLAAGVNYAVPAYIVGSNKLHVYVGGLRCDRGTDPAVAQYQEVGVTGAASTVIKFFDAQPAGTQITASAAG